MREQAASGRLTLHLQKGELLASGAAAALARALRPGLGGRLTLTALAGTTAVALLAAELTTLGMPVAVTLALSGVVGAGMAAWLRQQALAPLRQAIAVARRMSAGDLSQNLASDRFDEVGQLARALTQLNVNLQAIVGDVRREVEGITLASSEIAKGNQDLGNRTESQASSLQQTAASMEQITGTIRHTADTAHTAADLAYEASAVAQRSGEAAHTVTVRMAEIRQSSQRIAEIIGTFESISFQTNILALNAAVEAARACRAGRSDPAKRGDGRGTGGRGHLAARPGRGGGASGAHLSGRRRPAGLSSARRRGDSGGRLPPPCRRSTKPRSCCRARRRQRPARAAAPTGRAPGRLFQTPGSWHGPASAAPAA